MWLSTLLALTAAGIVCFASPLHNDLDEVGPVVMLNLLFRHGDRTPIDPYPNDPYGNVSYWPVSWGQLLDRGKERHYELGKWLRSRYGSDIFGDDYRKEVIHIISTDVDRTLMSAMSNLAGLYPPTKRWNFNLNWQPIPVHTTPENLDQLLAMKFPCKKYDVEYEKLKKSPFVAKVDEKYKELYTYLTEKTGHKVYGVTEVEYLYSNLHIETLFNFTLPEWTKQVYPEPMKSAASISFALPTFNKQLARLKSGPLVKQMLSDMKQKAEGTISPKERKVFMYSAHDTTVANFLNTLQVFNMINPPYTSLVIVELRQGRQDNKYYVNILYKNETDTAYKMKLAGKCGDICTLEEFTNTYSDIIPDNWEKECHQHTLFDLTSHLPYNSLAIFAMVGSTLIVFVLLASASLYWQRHQAPSPHLYKKLKMENL